MGVVRRSGAVGALLQRATVAKLQARDVPRGEVQPVFGSPAEPVPLGSSCAVVAGATFESRHPLGCALTGHLIVLAEDISPTGDVMPQAKVRTNAGDMTSPTIVVRSTA